MLIKYVPSDFKIFIAGISKLNVFDEVVGVPRVMFTLVTTFVSTIFTVDAVIRVNIHLIVLRVPGVAVSVKVVKSVMLKYINYYCCSNTYSVNILKYLGGS